jgi:hypothetical protein
LSLGTILGLVEPLVVAAGAVALVVRPGRAPWVVLPGLLLSFRPLAAAWRAAEGTALRPAVAWGFVALAFGTAAEGAALFEPVGGGRPAAGHLAYFCTLAVLAALVSVLNARQPGGGAWGILMALLVLVFLIPWLEGPGLGRAPSPLARLHLDNPWTLFYGLLVLAGVTNYLPTRFGPAAAWLGLGLCLEYLGLTRVVPTPAGLAAVWAAVPWTVAAAALTAERRARSAPPARGALEALWFWFRDHWGVVWALRVLERFNRSAASNGWPFRLAWQGVVPAPGAKAVGEVPGEAAAVLKGLLRRFATWDRLERAARRGDDP